MGEAIIEAVHMMYREGKEYKMRSGLEAIKKELYEQINNGDVEKVMEIIEKYLSGKCCKKEEMFEKEKGCPLGRCYTTVRVFDECCYYFFFRYRPDKEGTIKGLPDISDTAEIRNEIREFWARVEELENGVEE